MSSKDKGIVSLLVSVGVFSPAQAVNYVGTLSAKEKEALLTVSGISTKRIVYCDSVGLPFISPLPPR